MNQIRHLGWDDEWEKVFREEADASRFPARIAGTSRRHFMILTENGEEQAHLAGRFRHRVRNTTGIPVAGDWVVVERREDSGDHIIHDRLPRRSHLGRKIPGRIGEEQILAANLDKLMIVSALDGGRSFNIPRLRRFVTLAHSGHTNPVIVVNKTDLVDDTSQYEKELKEAFADVPSFFVSAVSGSNMRQLGEFIKPTETIAFVGLSGVGKSSLVNHMLGEYRQEVSEVREEDRRGRHTTVTRELIEVPGHGLVIDTPGVRELQIVAVEDNIENAFPEIGEWAGQCKFRDCTHEAEPGCRVREALERGELEQRRYDQFLQLNKERKDAEERITARGRRERKKDEKRQTKNLNRRLQQKHHEDK